MGEGNLTEWSLCGLLVKLLNKEVPRCRRGWIDLSLSTVPVEPLCGDAKIGGNATSFVWEGGKNTYLSNNWHVVTLCDTNTGSIIKNTLPPKNLGLYLILTRLIIGK